MKTFLTYLNNLTVLFIIVFGPLLWAFGLIYILEEFGNCLP